MGEFNVLGDVVAVSAGESYRGFVAITFDSGADEEVLSISLPDAHKLLTELGGALHDISEYAS